MLERTAFLQNIHEAFSYSPVVTLLGPRQCGKTTLARQFFSTANNDVTFFDLEDPQHFDQLQHPKTTLDPLTGLIVIDEVQRCPKIFPYLRVLVDYDHKKKLLLLGSASGDLLHQASESLAGRVETIEITPFNLPEAQNFHQLWLRGGFPRSYLGSSYQISMRWRKNYLKTYIERDLPLLGINLNAHAMRQLWNMLAHVHGNLLNYSELGRSLGLSDMTIRRYLEILEQTFMIRLLQPWHENISKRQIRAPKVYIRDSGMLHLLIGLEEQEWIAHPKKGASFEGFVIEELHRLFEGVFYFWRTQTGAELDLLLIKNGKRYGFEIKYQDVPSITKSMHIALNDLNLERLFIIIPHTNTYQKSDKITVVGVQNLININSLL